MDWRWARARGFYDGEKRRWDESRGGVAGYIHDARKRRLKRGARRESVRASPSFKQWKVGASSKEEMKRRAPPRKIGWVDFPMRPNLEGLEPVDLFCHLWKDLPCNGVNRDKHADRMSWM